MPAKAVRISLCITCKGRLHHLKKTLPANVRANRDFDGVEFVLLDYSSPDGLDRWVRERMAGELKSGRLVYFRLSGRKYYQPSHAKNLAHRLARGRIVCNLDADNYTGAGFARYLARQFHRRRNLFIRSRGTPGTSGRIALRKRDFERLGGYNEQMGAGWGFEDDDFAWRAKAAGLRELAFGPRSRFAGVLPHDDAERTQYMRTRDKNRSRLRNVRISYRLLVRGGWVANRGRRWGRGRVQQVLASGKRRTVMV